MINKVAFSFFCALQVVYGQEDPENNLQVLFNTTNEEINDVVSPLIARQQALAYENGEEYVHLELERNDLREDLRSLINSTMDVDYYIPNCFLPALVNLTRIVDDRVAALREFTISQFSNISDVLMNFSFITDEEKSLVLETTQSIEDCKALETEDEINDCISELIPTFNVTSEDIINRIRELEPAAEEVLTTAEENQTNIIGENQNYIDDNVEIVREELIVCLQS